MVKSKTKKLIKLSWTPRQLEIAAKAQGGASQEDLAKEGYTPSLVNKVFMALKAGQPIPSDTPEDRESDRETDRESEAKNRESEAKKLPKGEPPIEVGKITIKPENWALSQYGAIVVLDTYNRMKQDIGYTGTIGEFLCDMCEFYRRIVDYREVHYGREASRSSGDGGTEANGGSRAEERTTVAVW